MELSTEIRSTLAPMHAQIEQLPFAAAMVGGNVRRDEYAAMLGRLLHLHEGLEEALGRSGDAARFYDASMARAEAIRTDLQALGEEAETSPCEAIETLCVQFQAWRVQHPMRLVGALYVVEGSRMGSMMLVRPLGKALGVPAIAGNGLDYHLDGIRDRPAAWKRFKLQLDSQITDAVEREDVLLGATATMEGLLELYAISAREAVVA